MKEVQVYFSNQSPLGIVFVCCEAADDPLFRMAIIDIEALNQVPLFFQSFREVKYEI